MAKLIVHIGLPKTATTSLQYEFFPKLNKNIINFIGVYQPREGIQSGLYQMFCSSIRTGQGIPEVRDLLMCELEKGKDILISEEGILASEEKVTWKDKLNNLYSILGELEYKLIITVRHPVDAAFSYYIEQYFFFKEENKSFIELVKDSEALQIYKYEYFFNYLIHRFKEENIYLETFENIIANNFTKLFAIFKLREDITLNKLNNYNKKIVNRTSIELVSHKSLFHVLKKQIISNKILSVNQISRVKNYFFINKLSSLRIKKTYKIPILSDHEKTILGFFYKDDIDYLHEKFNINYK